MPVHDISDGGYGLVSAEPVETVRTLVRLRSKVNNLGDVVYAFAGPDPERGHEVDAVLTLGDLTAMTAEIKRLRAEVETLRAQPVAGPVDGTSTCWHVRTRKRQIYGVGASGKTDARTLVARRLAEAGEDDSPTTADRIGQWPFAYGTVLHYGGDA